MKLHCLNLSRCSRFVFTLIDCYFFLFAVRVERTSWTGRLIVTCGASFWHFKLKRLVCVTVQCRYMSNFTSWQAVCIDISTPTLKLKCWIMKRSSLCDHDDCCPCMHALVRDIAGFRELVGRKKSLLPDLGSRILVSLGCWNRLLGCATSALLWWEHGYFFLSCKCLWDWDLHVDK